MYDERKIGLQNSIAAPAIQPELVSALQSLAQTTLIKDIAPQLAPMALVKSTSVVGVLTELFENTQIKGLLENLKGLGKDVEME